MRTQQDNAYVMADWMAGLPSGKRSSHVILTHHCFLHSSFGFSFPVPGKFHRCLVTLKYFSLAFQYWNITIQLKISSFWFFPLIQNSKSEQALGTCSGEGVGCILFCFLLLFLSFSATYGTAACSLGFLVQYWYSWILGLRPCGCPILKY